MTETGWLEWIIVLVGVFPGLITVGVLSRWRLGMPIFPPIDEDLSLSFQFISICSFVIGILSFVSAALDWGIGTTALLVVLFHLMRHVGVMRLAYDRKQLRVKQRSRQRRLLRDTTELRERQRVLPHSIQRNE